MKNFIISILLIVLVAGCAGRLKQPEFRSGFLSDYRFLKPNPRKEDSWIRVARGFQEDDLQNYKKIAIAPIEIWLDPNKAANIVDKEKQHKLTRYFEQQIKQKAADKYEFVEPGTKDSLTIRIALTNIQELEPELSPLDILPFRIVMKVGKEVYLLAAAKKAVIGAASLEAELVDTNTGKGLVAIIVNSKTGEVDVPDDEANVESVKLVVDQWVESLAQALSRPNTD